MTSSDMAMDTMCAYPTSQNALLHWKCVLRCCSNYTRIYLPDQKSDRHSSNESPSMRFNIYYLI